MDTKKDEQHFTMLDWWKKVLIENYANFEGRARRAEYWYYILMNIILGFSSILFFVIIGVITDIFEIAIVGYIIFILYTLIVLIPSIAVAVRRLHDTNKTGWLYLLNFVPFGGLVLFIFYCIEGDKGANQYGTDPKNEGYTDEIDAIGKE